MTYRILVTGSRNWQDEDLISMALTLWATRAWRIHGYTTPVTVVHGKARGADKFASEWAHDAGMNWQVVEEGHAAEWDLYGKKAGTMRNLEMVALGADVCLAFPTSESIGTYHCMRAAQKAGIPVVDLGFPK